MFCFFGMLNWIENAHVHLDPLSFHSRSISKSDERSCFLYVLYNSDDFQLYFPSDLHCKGWAPPTDTLLKLAAKDNMREELQCHECFWQRMNSWKTWLCELVSWIIFYFNTVKFLGAPGTIHWAFKIHAMFNYPSVVWGSGSHIWEF